MTYPDSINLPFNNAAIRDGYTPLGPGDVVPEGPGFWAALQGSALVVRQDGSVFVSRRETGPIGSTPGKSLSV